MGQEFKQNPRYDAGRESGQQPSQPRQPRQSISDALGALWPNLRYLGLGIWLAWLYLCYSGSWLSDVEVDGSNLATLSLVMTFSSAFACLAAPFLPGFFEKIYSSRAATIGFSALASVGSLCVILAGPYYLAVVWLFPVGLVLSGFGSSFITLKAGSLFGGLQPKRALVFTLLSQLLMAATFYFVLGNDFYQPIPGGPSLSGILALVLLPIAATYLLTIRTSGTGDTPASTGDAPASEGSNEGSMPQTRLALYRLPPIFWKFLLAILVLMATSSAVRGYYISLHAPSATIVDSTIIILLRFAFALGLILLALRSARFINLGKIYLFTMVIIAVVLAALPLLMINVATLGNVIGFATNILEFVVWCLLAFIVFEKKVSPLVVFGFGNGVLLAGEALGWYIGISVLPTLDGSNMLMVVYILMAVLILLSTTLIFSEKDFDRLFSSLAEGGTNLQEILTADKEPLYVDGDRSSRPRPWMAAVKKAGRRAHLSSREQEVLEMLALGRPPENIAQRMSISLSTVRTHTHNLYAKLDVHSRQELLQLIESYVKG